MHHPKGFPAKLARLRADAEMTQKDLSRASGISVPQIGRYETGVSKPRMTALVKLAKALDVPVEVLQDYDDEPESVSLILETEGGAQMQLVLKKKILDRLDEISVRTGQSLDDLIGEAIDWGLAKMKEDPEFAVELARRAGSQKKMD
ncbi:TPA: helix-turn-helix transcriptional regulator [Pseudomonas aeruginosa]|uniref:helix-turn-helix domain-containing protein n=2 Tax=Pseudomonas aeruginosa TaxID=287 RepID=UPI00068C745A|nr:helix-turn-helix transcriptional regulator [Pseudomonas aeruginosa]MBG6739744.1 helix-turn-helix transcriptional regulator [Pseudomonas aeruginosa]MCC0378659.1 helix-turn-helix transcriptional regulator [Pseudomonas aeruginosa]MCO3228610.1 helix-turn-helix transcriptional regulator [Pseudomonas aeruginosa]MDP5590518.1 helix-turn-helix transcriptional regulator [Pseudomonas aeruginosa]MDU0668348.1 helix-turn-helix transcriptional regulator [Pseudomonas aeruginosa]